MEASNIKQISLCQENVTLGSEKIDGENTVALGALSNSKEESASQLTVQIEANANILCAHVYFYATNI